MKIDKNNNGPRKNIKMLPDVQIYLYIIVTIELKFVFSISKEFNKNTILNLNKLIPFNCNIDENVHS